MNRRRLLIVTLLLVLLAGGSLAALLALRGGDEVERSAGGFRSQTGGTSTAAPAEPENGTVSIRFVLNDSYEAGETVAVAIENTGTKAYVFQSYYQACSLSYFDSRGRPFIIPPGTHCDLLAEETIRPGERKKLFTWKLDECVKDAWGCVKSRPLAPGTYTIKGLFKPKFAGPRARVETTFRIVAT
jgi:hypothetical protein